MSAQTAATAKKKATKPISKNGSPAFGAMIEAGTFRLVAEKAKTMSPAEFRMSLVKAGIIGTNGKLTARYARPKKIGKKRPT